MTDDLVQKFDRGRRRGRDPVNTGVDGRAITTPDSIWLAATCDECGHTFRRGDPVYVKYGADIEVRHHSPALPCSHQVEDAGAETGDTDRGRAFHEALDRANPPPTGMHAERLLPGHPLLVEVRPRLHCAFCSKTFRPYEIALWCPCRPADPHCNRAVHRDPGAGNDCYDAWIANGALVRCPTTFEKLR